MLVSGCSGCLHLYTMKQILTSETRSEPDVIESYPCDWLSDSEANSGSLTSRILSTDVISVM